MNEYYLILFFNIPIYLLTVKIPLSSFLPVFLNSVDFNASFNSVLFKDI